MAGMTLEALMEEVKALPLETQQRLRNWLDTRLSHSTVEHVQEEVDQRLLEAGIIRSIPQPIQDLSPYRNRKLIENSGKPLSEVILEERR